MHYDRFGDRFECSEFISVSAPQKCPFIRYAHAGAKMSQLADYLRDFVSCPRSMLVC